MLVARVSLFMAISLSSSRPLVIGLIELHLELLSKIVVGTRSGKYEIDHLGVPRWLAVLGATIATVAGRVRRD